MIKSIKSKIAPTVINISAKLKMGQIFRSIKSITPPLDNLSHRFATVPLIIKAISKLPFSLKKTPPPPFINYPPPPQFIKIGNFYFSKPLKLNEENYITVSALYAILCKKNNKYDIIYIGNVEGNNEEPANLLENEQYNCWLEYCGQETKNLYVAFRILKKNQKKKEEKIQKILEILENQTNPVCQTSNSHSESINN